MVGMSQYYVGNIFESHPLDLGRIGISGECMECRIRGFCGGRCLYSNITQPWSETDRQLVCATIHTLHDALHEALPLVQALIRESKITLKDFEHEKFNGCEIIP